MIDIPIIVKYMNLGTGNFMKEILRFSWIYKNIVKKTYERVVDRAAPEIPNNGIKTRFKMVFNIVVIIKYNATFFSTSNLLNLIIFLILSLTIYAILTLPFLVKIIKEFFLILKQ